MDKELKQQINDWTASDLHQNVINALEKIPPTDRGFEETGLLARAYNYSGDHAKALALLQSTQEEGEKDTNWNFRMGYALYYLDRYKESLSYFTKADELTPGDEDTIDFIRYCNKAIPFRNRVDDFWQWFLQHEAELSRMVEKRSEYEHEGDEVVEFISQGTDLIAKDIHFNIGGDYEFTFSVEGAEHLFYLYPYLISRMPEQLKGKWHFFPYNQGKDCLPFGFRMCGVDVDTANVYVDAVYDEDANEFAISFFEKDLCALPEEQSLGVFCIMMEIVLGEGVSYCYISDVKRADNRTETMTPLPELRKRITKELSRHGKKLIENPQEVYTGYQMKPEENEELRYDVIVGSTCFHSLLNQYYQDDTDLFDKINRFGAQAVYIAYPHDINDSESLNFRHDLEDRIESEILKPEGLGLLLGGASGMGNCYIDILLYDVRPFMEKIIPLLSEYPQHSFYLSDFRQHCWLTRLSQSEKDI